MENKESCCDIVAEIRSINLSVDEGDHFRNTSIGRDCEGSVGDLKERNLNIDRTINISNVSINQIVPSIGKEDLFYENAQKYWSKIPATINGMLGGFGSISSKDICASVKFLNEVAKLKPLNKDYALDCGAGIGRITKGLLIPMFNKVDIVEQDPMFCQRAMDYIGGGSGGQLLQIYNVGLQEFYPEEDKYDLVWCQWVLGHLTDEDLLKFLRRIQKCLTKNGILVLKENVTSSDNLEFDEIDSSVTRPLKIFVELSKASGYKIIKLSKQTNFPRNLYPVYMIACRPRKIKQFE